MSAASTLSERAHVFQVGTDYRFEVEYRQTTQVPSYLRGAGPKVWLWCEGCERAFRLGDARTNDSGVGCAYSDCAGEPLDFWSWAAYCAFVGAAEATPEPQRRYPLAA